MVTLARLLLAAVLSAVGLGVFAQELVIFNDNRSLQVQSHRVDGAWTYLRIASSGEMAVPSASILRVDTERATVAAAVLPQQKVPPSGPAAPSPTPANNGADSVRRPSTPPPVAAVNPEEDEEDQGVDEEMDEPEPPEPPAKAPDLPQANPGMPQQPGMAPGMPPGMPARPGVFPQQNNPAAQPQKQVDDD